VRPNRIPVHWPGPVRLWVPILFGHLLASQASLPANLLTPARSFAFAAGLATLAAAALARRMGSASARRMGRFEAPLGFAAAVLAGVALGAEADRATWPLPVHPNETQVELEGRVLDTTASDAETGSVLFEARRVRVGGAESECRARVTLRWREDALPPRWLLPGLWLRLSGSFRPPEDARNPGTDAPGRWLERAGVAGTVTVDPASPSAPPDPPERGADWGAIARDRLARLFAAELSAPVAGLARGMILGDRSGIAPGIRDAFRDGGTIHILSISGLHVCILAGFAAIAGAALRWPLLPALALEMAVLWGYVLLVGSPASALRSAILWTALRGGRALGQVARPFAAWGLAGLTLHLASPTTVLDPGFQLSFAAVLGLGAAAGLRLGGEGPRDRGFRAGIRQRLAQAGSVLAMGGGAEAGTAAIQARLFGALPVVGVVLNVAVVPLCTLFMAESVLFLASHLLPIAGFPAAASGALEITGDILLLVNAWGAGLVGPWIVPRPPSAAAAALAIFALLLAWGRVEALRGSGARGMTAAWSAGAMALALLAGTVPLSPGASPPPTLPVILALDVGQGDATWVGLPGGGSLLIDAGPSDERRDAGAVAVEPAFRVEGAARPVTAILSHAHLDHYGGLGWLAGRGWIGGLFENGSDPQGAWRSLREGIDDAGGMVAVVSRDTVFGLGDGVELEFRRADRSADPAWRENDRSLAATLRVGGATLFFPGDLESAGESALLDSLQKVDVLKAPHHGSRTSSGAAWVDRLAPSIVTISAGERNRFGHPDRAVIGRYLRGGARVFRTDREGAIRITLAASGAWVSTRAHPEPCFVSWRRRHEITRSAHFP